MAENTKTEKPNENSDVVPLGKITPLKSDVTNDEESKTVDISFQEKEKYLIEATRLLLREYGIRKSGAAIRDSVDIT